MLHGHRAAGVSQEGSAPRIGADAAAPPASVAFLLSTAPEMDPRARKVAHSLAAAGHAVTLIAWDRRGRGTRRECFEGLDLLRFGIPASSGSGLRQLPAMLAFWARAVWHLIATSYAVVHCNRFDTLVPALCAGLLRHRPVFYDLHMSYADRLAIHDTQPGMRLVRRTVAAVELYALRHRVGHAFTDSPVYTRELQRRGVSAVTTLLNLPPLAFAATLPDPPPREDAFTFGRIGAFSRQLGQGAEELVHLLQRLRAEAPELDARLLCVGNFVPAGYLRDVQQCAAPFGHCTINEYVSQAEVPAWYARLDLSVIHYQVAGAARYMRFASVQKLFECMACGVPVVLLANDYVESVVREVGCGVVPERRDAEGLFQACLLLARDPGRRAQLGAAGRRTFLERYHWEREEEQLVRAYRSITRRTGPE